MIPLLLLNNTIYHDNAIYQWGYIAPLCSAGVTHDRRCYSVKVRQLQSGLQKTVSKPLTSLRAGKEWQSDELPRVFLEFWGCFGEEAAGIF